MSEIQIISINDRLSFSMITLTNTMVIKIKIVVIKTTIPVEQVYRQQEYYGTYILIFQNAFFS